jgi:glycosyltransferase involved in cell wall biosynthesis
MTERPQADERTSVPKRPATLLISPWTPYPLVFGGAIRVYSTIRMLDTFSDVTLLAYKSWSDQPPAEIGAHLERLCERVVLVPGKPDRPGREQVRSLASRHSYQYWMHHTRRFQHAIDEITREQEFASIVVTSTPMGFFQLPAEPFSVLDLHNIEYELVLRRAQTSTGVRRAVLKFDGRKLRAEELSLCRQFDVVFTPSDRERDALLEAGSMPPIHTIPNTIDTDATALVPCPSGDGAPHLLFVGPTHVDANRDGVVWFVRNVLPVIKRTVPDAVVDIVGGNAPADVAALASPSVHIHGYVADLDPFLRRASVAIVPLRVGGGTRLKILNSLAHGIPTVSTSVGAEGLDLEDGRDLLIADDPETFAKQVELLLRDAELRAIVRDHGRRSVEARYSWQAVAPLLQSAIVDRAPS